MITRTVRAETMMQALAQVKNDLGTEALVVSARQISGGQPWQVWRKPMVEVVAVRLEPGEDASMVVKKELKETVSEVVKQPIVKDLTRKDTILPKQGNLTGGHQRKQSTQQQVSSTVQSDLISLPDLAGPAVATEDPLSKVQSVDVIELQGKRAGHQAAVNPKIGLLQQLGREEDSEDLNILQVSSGTKPALPLLQLPEPPWKPPQEVLERPDGAWPLLEKLYRHLLQQGIETGLVKRVCQISADTLGYQAALDENRVIEHLRRQLEAYIKVLRESSPKEHQVICVIGPSGAGKTSFCAKLAVRYRQVLKRSVAWVCADTIRTGGIAEAKSYSEAISIPLRVAYTPQELFAAVESFRSQDLVIVDTPACNPRNEESLVEIGTFLTVIPNRITWVVVPATSKENDLMNTVAALNSFRPRALVATKLDETNSFGAVYNLAFRSQLPFTYFTRGAGVLDDLMPAAASRLVQAFFTERFD
jgi:flagellar biosynthesis protein FlhF